VAVYYQCRSSEMVLMQLLPGVGAGGTKRNIREFAADPG